MKTMVAEPQQDGSWKEVECIIPLMTNNEKTARTIGEYVDDERQLYVEGYLKSWPNAQGTLEYGVMISHLKLGSKTMYDTEQQGGAAQPAAAHQHNEGATAGMPGFPFG